MEFSRRFLTITALERAKVNEDEMASVLAMKTQYYFVAALQLYPNMAEAIAANQPFMMQYGSAHLFLAFCIWKWLKSQKV